jgi:PTS system nitrogen regulatory IIA component
MHIATILPPGAVFARILARDRKQLLKILAADAAKLTRLSEREIFSVLMEREQSGSTAMGNGVCIPHGRFASLMGLHAAFATLEKPVEFGAADGRPVDLVFLLLSPTAANIEHIKALASISRLLRDKQLCESLRKAPDAKTLHSLLIAANNEEAALG